MRTLALLLLSTTPAMAQATATIHGTVLDASSASIPEARVTATNLGSNQSRSVSTDEAGRYVIPLLPIGAYTVRIEKQGFHPFLQQGVLLQVNTDVEVNANLEVGGTTEQVNISSQASLVQTNSSAMVQVVDQQRVADLPLNGRNVLQLLTLNAGVSDRNVPATVQGSNLGFGTYQVRVSINGARGINGNFLLDNADHNEAQTNLPRPFPNVDAVQEFSVQTSSFDAQYGRGVGGVVNVVTKGGTNEFHGSLFEFFRNYKLNAANFFTGRDALKRNQFGGALGGPIVKDRTFFFVSYQGTRIRSATPGALRTAPSEAMKNGNFAEWLRADGQGAIVDPRAPGQLFPGNIIPRSRFDPVSSKLLSAIPSTPDPRYQLRFGTPVSITDDNQLIARGDHLLTPRHRLSARYFFLRFNNPPVILPTNLLYASDGTRGDEHAISFNHTFTISSTWLNNFNFSYNTSEPARITATEPQLTLEALGARVKNSPRANLLTVSPAGWSGISLGNVGYSITKSLHLSNTVSYATGRHNLRFGGDFRRYRTGFESYFLTGGQASFSGQLLSERNRQNAGNAYAEFLLGVVASWRQLSTSRLEAINPLYAAFLQDDLRITPKLTLNLGLRYDPKLGLIEGGNQHTTFIAGRQSTMFPRAPLGLLFTGDEGVGSKAIPNDWNNLAPRVGVAWNFLPKTVLRAAYGLFYDEYMGLFYNRTIQGQPWVADATLVGPLQLSDPYAGGAIVEPDTYKPDRNLNFLNFSTYAVPTRSMRAGYMQNWNLVIERELPRSILFRAAYVGSKGTHLLMTAESNAGVYGPGATAANLNARRPYARIGPLQLGTSSGNSIYNSLQLTAQRRLAHGVSILANYTWSKAIDYASFGSIEGNQTGPDPINIRNNRGPADFDLTHRMVVSGIWELPRLANWNPVGRWILGEWQQNAIFSAQTGTPLTIRSGVDNDFNGVGGDFGDYRGGDWKLGNRTKEQQIQRWFNTQVFALNAIGTIGSARRGQLRAPGDWNIDYSIFKNFPLAESKRLQFRAELFNAINHANLGEPNTSANSPNFGLITSASAPRIVQLALKLIF
ncbi:MAG: TonB-dependent receptor [Acidobacteria bacterium]|nr:TonB-dependent receptor [Acidobacteriota bacterium]